eukprot:TRINITY_DN2384_c0_g1_i1.p2 TRINITY_DN2384_c0_g1~~TRINITY_DN2384_c0_g1_i1.p2  ORF type:complete len:173 (-),score=35.86 TRINITY_DN2384_c0_g1_i1:51-569(-)
MITTMKCSRKSLYSIKKTDEFTAKVLGDVSDEVQKIAKDLHAQASIDTTGVPKLDDMMREMYGTELSDDSTIKSIFATNKGYAGLFAPCVEVPGGFKPNFKYRYLTEDIPNGFCVLKGFALITKTPTPTIDKVLAWAENWMQKDYLGKDLHETAAPQNLGCSSLSDLKALYT